MAAIPLGGAGFSTGQNNLPVNASFNLPAGTDVVHVMCRAGSDGSGFNIGSPTLGGVAPIVSEESTPSSGNTGHKMLVFSFPSPVSGPTSFVTTTPVFDRVWGMWQAFSTDAPQGSRVGAPVKPAAANSALLSTGGITCPPGGLVVGGGIHGYNSSLTAAAGTTVAAGPTYFGGGPPGSGFIVGHRNTTGPVSFNASDSVFNVATGITILGLTSGPALTAPTKSDTATTLTGGFTTTGTDGTARAVFILRAGPTPVVPTVANVKAGHNASGNTTGVVKPADLAITSAGVKNFAAATGATTGATYDGYAVHTSAADSDSDLLSLGVYYPGTGRPVEDVAANGYTASTGTNLSAMLSENAPADRSTWINSGTLTTSFVPGPILKLNKPYGAGTYSGIKVDKDISAGTGEFRVNFLDDSNALVGQTSAQAMNTTPTLYTLSATLSATATRLQIEERAV